MKNYFIAGDKVKTVTGGPEMTIRGPHYNVDTNEYCETKYDCIWFVKTKDGKEEVRYQPFDQDELIKTK